ncbi:Hypothetical protein NGAL_HAMBI1189_25220 [Neorhizobium galegae bv. officinalis]|uniref:Uncharacterized protein n=1 Tax=Neorhizobium galegae bv. officinalis TaxID=323656 RepID=A0A0T7GMP6_NEOGA|nr:Hypothetical protein NGAL_HAMBI1189_25220 [Neorhizobium galegae bv. officinalis]
MASEEEIRQAFREQIAGGQILGSPFTARFISLPLSGSSPIRRIACTSGISTASTNPASPASDPRAA